MLKSIEHASFGERRHAKQQQPRVCFLGTMFNRQPPHRFVQAGAGLGFNWLGTKSLQRRGCLPPHAQTGCTAGAIQQRFPTRHRCLTRQIHTSAISRTMAWYTHHAGVSQHQGERPRAVLDYLFSRGGVRPFQVHTIRGNQDQVGLDSATNSSRIAW